jgi:hypothetical protein
MSENRIGGGESQAIFYLIFFTGVLIGSSVRIAAFIMPKRTVEYFMEKLLPMSRPD